MSAHQGVPNTSIYRAGECDTSAVTMDTVTTVVEKRWQWHYVQSVLEAGNDETDEKCGCVCVVKNSIVEIISNYIYSFLTRT